MDRLSHPSPPALHLPSLITVSLALGLAQWQWALPDSACSQPLGSFRGCSVSQPWIVGREQLGADPLNLSYRMEFNQKGTLHWKPTQWAKFTCLWISRSSNAWVTANSPSTLFNVGRALTPREEQEGARTLSSPVWEGEERWSQCFLGHKLLRQAALWVLRIHPQLPKICLDLIYHSQISLNYVFLTILFISSIYPNQSNFELLLSSHLVEIITSEIIPVC